MPQPSQQPCCPRVECLAPDKEALGAAELSPPCLSAGPPCRTQRTGPVVLPWVWEDMEGLEGTKKPFSPGRAMQQSPLMPALCWLSQVLLAG